MGRPSFQSAKAMDQCVLQIRAAPNSAKDEIQGWLGDSLKVRIQAPPTDGKANERLCAFLAETLSLPKGAVTLVSGASSRQKRVSIRGLSEQQVRGKLS
jgi:uncharacterized protein (TIGR00251 family)